MIHRDEHVSGMSLLIGPRNKLGSVLSQNIFWKWDVRARIGLIWLRIRTLAGTCKRGNEPSGSIKFGEILD